jgi:hypothetical protein
MARRGCFIVLLLTGLLGWTGYQAGGQALRPGEFALSLTGGRWINSPPLPLEDLRGRVVLLEFWTYG